MMCRQSGMISVVRRKFMTSEESLSTGAPMTASEGNRMYSNERDSLAFYPWRKQVPSFIDAELALVQNQRGMGE